MIYIKQISCDAQKEFVTSAVNINISREVIYVKQLTHYQIWPHFAAAKSAVTSWFKTTPNQHENNY